MPDLLHIIKNTAIGLVAFFSLLGQGQFPPTNPVVVQETPKPELGVSISALSDFRSSITAGISDTATEMTLTTFTSGSETLIEGDVYGFKLGGREYVIGTASTSNKIVNMTRGLSRKTSTTTISSYREIWGRGTSVEMTDAPIVIDLANKATGRADYDNPIRYSSSLATTTIADNEKNLVNVALLNDTAFSGASVVSASETARGFVEISTDIETASSTSSGGTTARLAIPASLATSTYNPQTAPLRVVVTGNDGKIDSNFLSGVALTSTNNTWTGSNTFSTSTTATTTIGAFPAWEIGKQKQIFTADGTFTVPTGISKVIVHVVGGGGGGGSYSGAGGQSSGGGGGAGGYCFNIVDVTATTSIKIIVGSGGSAGSSGGLSNFSTYCSATGGSPGANAGSASGAAGGVAGLGSLGLINTYGQGGSVGGAGCQCGGSGGASFIGGGAAQGGTPGYGGGGNGSSGGSGGQTNGASGGGNGIVIVTW